jgi:hypothetical protein
MIVFVRIHASTAGSRIVWDGLGAAPPIGYYQRLGVTAADAADLIAIVKGYLEADTGARLLDVDAMEVADLAGQHQDLRDVCGESATRGVWYASGRGFYSGDGDDDESSGDA